MRNTAVSRCHRRGLHRHTALASAVTLTAIAAALAAGGPPAQAALSGHRPGAATPDATASTTALQGVSAVSPSDAWAAGYYFNSAGAALPFTAHWNGTAWKRVTAAAPISATNAALNGVSAVSAGDAWAAGWYLNSSGEEPLILHWNGTAWKVVKSPAPSGAQGGYLQGVSADSPSDAWAAGTYFTSSGQEPLTEHWNGTAWKLVKSPAPSGAASPELTGVSAVSPGDAWAAGDYTSSSGQQPLVLHWNGTTWKQAAVSGPQNTYLTGVSAASATDAWATGYYETSNGNVPVTLHRTGTAWKPVKSPLPRGAQSTQLTGVSAVSQSDAWATGCYVISGAGCVANGTTPPQPLTEHWTGTTWKLVKTPAPSGARQTFLQGVSADSSSDAWAAGYYTSSGGGTETLILHWNGTAWTKVASPNGP